MTHMMRAVVVFCQLTAYSFADVNTRGLAVKKYSRSKTKKLCHYHENLALKRASGQLRQKSDGLKDLGRI